MIEKQTFQIGDTEFEIENIVFEIDRKKSVISKLEIYGSKTVFDKISGDEDSKWSWALYPPKFYLYGVPYKEYDNCIELEINEELLENSDIALYFMEHNDFFGNLSVKNNEIEISGTVDIMGKELPLTIKFSVPFGA